MKLEIKSKSYGLHWGIGYAEIASDIFDVDANDVFFNSVLINLESQKQLGVSKEAVFGALLNWCEENDVKAEFTYANFRNAYNDFSEELQQEILADYKKSKYAGKIVGEIFDELIASYQVEAKEEDKKKVIPLKTSSKTASNGAKRTTKK